MAKKPTLNDITISFADVTQLNQNWDRIETSFENTLSRDGSTPNAMLSDIDLNGNDLLNVGSINGSTDLATTVARGTIEEYVPFTRAEVTARSIDSSVDAIRTAGYTTVGDGGGATYKRVGAEPAHEFKVQSADGAWWEGVAEFPTPLQLGAAMDGTTDDTIPITNADAYAADKGRAVWFPSGTYRCDKILMTASWLGSPGATLKSHSPSITAESEPAVYDFIQCRTAGLNIKGLIFDGNASADPGTWGASTYDAFTGTIGLQVYADDVSIEDCTFQNSVRATLHIGFSSNVTVRNTKHERARGEFGDGILVEGCVGVNVENAYISDVTRIGVVTEGGSGTGSHSCRFTNCHVENAHDQSSDYGGTETNAGFWFENSGNHVVTGCTAKDCNRRYFVATTGTTNFTNAPTTISTYVFEGCEAIGDATTGAAVGFLLASQSGQPVHATLTGCSAHLLYQCYQAAAANSDDVFTFVGCHAELLYNVSPASGDTMGFLFGETVGLSNPAILNVIDCTVDDNNVVSADLTSTSKNSAHVGTVDGGNWVLNIRNLRHVSNTPAYIKNIQTTAAATVSLNVSESYIIAPFFFVSGDNSKVERCQISGSTQFLAYTKVSLVDCDAVGTVFLYARSGGSIRMAGGSIDYGSGSEKMVFLTDTEDTKRPLFWLEDVRIEADINAGAIPFQINRTQTNKPHTFLKDCTFYNKGGSTATGYFIEMSDSNGVNVILVDCYADDNVTNFWKVSGTTLTNPASGLTKLTMH